MVNEDAARTRTPGRLFTVLHLTVVSLFWIALIVYYVRRWFVGPPTGDWEASHAYRERTDFLFVFMELDPPYAITPVRTTESMRTVGSVLWEKGKEKWAVALRDNHWPGYVEVGEVASVEASKWALERMIEQEMENDGN